MRFALPLFVAVLGFLFYIYYNPSLGKRAVCAKFALENADVQPSPAPSLETLTEEEKRQQWVLIQKGHAERARLDSIRLGLALEDALVGLQAVLGADSFATNYIYYTLDSSEEVWMEVELGHLFGEQEKWVLIRRHDAPTEDSYFDLFLIDPKDQLEHKLTHVQDAVTYMGDTIVDVNGDGRLDFVCAWYPAAGSYSRDISDVYLQLSNHQFSAVYSFINPVFLPKEGLILGLEYGDFSEGDTPLYKYKWNGLQVDTVEFIYKDPKQQNRYYKTSRTNFSRQQQGDRVLEAIPEEYQSIRNY